MSDSTRRNFLAVAGAGAVAAGAAIVVAPSANAVPESDALPAGAKGTMVAYIKDLKKGEVLVMTGDDEVVVTDKVLVARLANAFARASRS